jgi:hypothetical protein
MDDKLEGFEDDWAEREERDRKKALLQQGRKKDSVVMFSIRKKRLGILAGAQNNKQIRIRYTKTTTGETNWYTVAPYSYRTRRLKVGVRKMLFAYDMKDKHIKGFALRNIKQVEVLVRQPFTPLWPVAI